MSYEDGDLDNIGSVENAEKVHARTLSDERCRSHTVGTCQNCPADICPICEGSGFCEITAVDNPGGGMFVLDDRRIEVPCVSCRVNSGKCVRHA